MRAPLPRAPEVILLDEPTSALDPISTLKIEELIDELKQEFTIAIVTHNMQQAARCADQVAFFYLGELIEVGAGRADVYRAPAEEDARIHHRPVRLRSTGNMSDLAQHIVRSYEQELKQLRAMLVDMGGLLENQLLMATTAVVQHDTDAAAAAMEQDPAVDQLERDIEAFVIRMLALRQPMAQDLRQIVAALKISSDLERIGDYAANVAKRSIVLSQYNLSFTLGGFSHLARLVQESLKMTVDAIGENDPVRAMQVWAVRPGGGRHLHGDFPRADHLHDGRSAQHHAVHASAVRGEKP